MRSVDEYLGAIGVSNIDKKQITAVRKLDELGCTFSNNDWLHLTIAVAQAPADHRCATCAPMETSR
jgi:hypothetical protein